MKLTLLIYKNNYLECTGTPIFDDHTPEAYQKSMERFLKTGEKEKVFKYENCDLYDLGTYDDESMKFELHDSPILLLRCNDFLSSRKLKEEFLKAGEKEDE